MKYGDYLAHFNPNHDKLGRFAKNSNSSNTTNKTPRNNKKKDILLTGLITGLAVTGLAGIYFNKVDKYRGYTDTAFLKALKEDGNILLDTTPLKFKWTKPDLKDSDFYYTTPRQIPDELFRAGQIGVVSALTAIGGKSISNLVKNIKNKN